MGWPVQSIHKQNMRMDSGMDAENNSIGEAHRKRAISKLHRELEKDISGAVDIARRCGIWDLLRLLYEFRLSRICMFAPEFRDRMSKADIVGLHLNDEAMKYAISLVVKHGDWNNFSELNSPLSGFSVSRVHELEKITRYINAKYESEILLNVAEVEVFGERDEHCKINLEAGLRDPVRNMHMQFGLRIEKTARDGKNALLAIPVLLEKFRLEYLPLTEFYEQDNGISVEEFCQGMLDLHSYLIKRGREVEAELLDPKTNLVDPLLAKAFIKLSRTFVMTDSEMEANLNPRFLDYLRRNPFEPAAVSDSELRFHYVSRRPYFFGDGFAIISPELVFDSVMGNTRYTFLESFQSKQKFMELSAAQFIDKIADVASVAGYRVVGRDIYLKERKKDIGDIDLFLWNEELDHCLLIEAKNHMLPLPVYFRDPTAVGEHISRNRDWESKVKRRIDHLQGDNKSFCVIGNWDYLVVSLMPEPLSHVTDLLVLSLDEFETWVSLSPRVKKFADLHNILHTPDLAEYSPEDLKQMQDEGFVLMRELIPSS